MKFVIAQMQHETNTFSPIPTPWEAFGEKGPLLGRDAYDAMSGTRLPMAAFLDLARQEGAEVVTPVAAFANPSGPVDGAAYDRICDLVCEAVRRGCDAIFLDLQRGGKERRRAAVMVSAIPTRKTNSAPVPTPVATHLSSGA